MLSTTRLAQALEAHRSHLQTALAQRRGETASAAEALVRLSSLTHSEITDALRDPSRPGARPTAEHAPTPRQVVLFAARLRRASAARQWGAATLAGQTTVAVDGSRVSPPTTSIRPSPPPRFGWFINAHTERAPYEKDSIPANPRDGRGKRELDVRRFELEVERLFQLMQGLAGR